tara:strand:- start:5229 stop:6254 length:1026 start_codon:yes stop_codon:yes gene_type:complete
MKKNLYVISNEKIFHRDAHYFCDNLDMKSTPEGLNEYFNLKIIARKSNVSRAQKINLKSIKVFSNIFSYLYEVIKSSKQDNSEFLMISLSPYTFLASIFLKIFGKKSHLYLRSNGYDEYKIILGNIGKFIYHLMFVVISKISILISCRKYILMGRKGYIVSPSQLDQTWKENHVEPILNKIKLIYVGRIKKEKGIYSLLTLIKDQPKISLTIVGASEDDTKIINNENINIIKIVEDKKELINLYDNHNIMILPSFTEGYPMVVLESLSRLRPVIVFQDIEHVAEGREGIFVSKRNQSNFLETIEHIIENYHPIQESMKSNKLPDNYTFIKQLEGILSKTNL